MRKLLFFVILLTFQQVNAQVEFSSVKHDFGELYAYSSRYVDIILENKGSKKDWVLSIRKPREVAYIISSQIIPKDSASIIRFQVNPQEKGRFSYEIKIFTGNQEEPTLVKITGINKEVPQNDMSYLTDCPTFNDRPGGSDPNKFDLTVVTVDKESKELLSESIVTMIQNGRPVWERKTDRKGKIKEDATLGLSYFYAIHEGYYPAELGTYVNFKRNYVVVELEKDESADVPIIEVDTNIVAIVEPDPEPEILIEIEEHLETIKTEFDSTVVTELPPSFTDLSRDNFDPEYFKPVNVVFVLDVSSSMKQVDKIELMKYSMLQLVDMLRPQDKMGIVTYASDSRVLLHPTKGSNKEDIIEQVEALKAFGYTAGGEGIKLGFKEAKKGMIQDGTNHVIIITDGAFNRNSEDYEKWVKKYRKNGINFSVVGIKNKDVHEQEMRQAAELGGGHYVPIFNLADARNNLKQEIRVLSFKF